MKTHHLFFASIVAFGFSLNALQAQVAITTDGSSPHTSAMLEVKSIEKGLLIPRMTTTQRNALGASAIGGLMVYDNTLNDFFYHNGAGWHGALAGDYWTRSGTIMYNTNLSDYIGIGTSTPSRPFHVFGTDWKVMRLSTSQLGPTLELVGTATTDWAISSWSNYFYLDFSDDDFLTRTSRFAFSKTAFSPWVTSTIALGLSNFRWNNLYSDNGDFSNRVGIGISTPVTQLHISGNPVTERGQLCLTHPTDDDAFMTFYAGSTAKAYLGYTNGTAVWGSYDGSNLLIQTVSSTGNVGIGTSVPGYKLHVNGSLKVGNGTDQSARDVNMIRIGDGDYIRIGEWEADDLLSFKATRYSFTYGNVGIGVTNPTSKLDVQGNITVRNTIGTVVMELGTGLDYAEGFDVSAKSGIEPGTVLSIDPDNPGKLKICDQAYDTKVAGIVAGANGLGSGVRLGVEEFDYDVALAGRVYCNIDATRMAVKPGDLLTTSCASGYAMKADRNHAAKGAILGKAMEGMEKGKKGQILVLVTLQ